MERSPVLPASRQKARHVWLLAWVRNQGSRQTARRRRTQSAPHQDFGRRANSRPTPKEPAPAGKDPQRQDTGFRLIASKRPAPPEITQGKGFADAAACVGKFRIAFALRKFVTGGPMHLRRMVALLLPIAVVLGFGLLFPAHAPALAQEQAPNSQKSLTIEEYDPKSTLVVPEHKLQRAKFPFIDIHSHHWNPTPEEVDRLVKEMDTINLQVMVNLSGGTGEQLRQTVVTMKVRYPDRFVVFANLSYDDLNTPGYGMRAASRLVQDVKNGAQGLKIFKNYGMDVKYANGDRVHVDDPEFDPVWDKCAELKIPVLIHIAEPSPFFDPWDYHNER